MRVILLEDEYLLNNNIKEYLEFKGLSVENYLDGSDLLQESDINADIAVLDIEVPGASGFEVLEWIKRLNKDIPVIFMSAYTDIQSIKKGYSLGCSDYLKKPFDLEELWLRIEQLLDISSGTKIILNDYIVFDMQNEHLYKNTEMLKLTKIQRKILKILLKYKNELVTYELLINEVWEDNFVKDNTIASHIKEIRKLLPDGMIDSVRAEGYRLKLLI